MPEESPNCLSERCMHVQTMSDTSCDYCLSRTLKLTKTGESRLSALLLLSIERELTDNVDFNCVIDAFASVRQRCVPL